MTELQQVMLNLDIALTGNQPPEGLIRQIHHYPKTFEQWIMEPGGNPVWYLSDSGYSRVVWSMEDHVLFLTYNSTQRVRDRWEAAKPQREAAEAFLLNEENKLRQQESKAAELVSKLLD